MQIIPEVEEAKRLMTEAANWSVMKWLREKKAVRKAADAANAALDHLDNAIKNRWSDAATSAYVDLSKGNSSRQGPHASDIELVSLVKSVRKADEAAQKARADAERTFDEAEKLLSTGMAREGCKKAIASWELHEKAIGTSERLCRNSKK